MLIHNLVEGRGDRFSRYEAHATVLAYFIVYVMIKFYTKCEIGDVYRAKNP